MRLAFVLALLGCAQQPDAPAQLTSVVVDQSGGGKADGAREGRPLVIGALGYGETSSACAASTRTRAFAFSGAAGDSVRAWARGEDAEVWLADASFRALDSQAAPGGDGEARLPASGVFHVVFRAAGEVRVSLGGPDGTTCLSPLHEYCGDAPCHGHDDALAEARSAYPCYQASAGTCGPFRYVSWSNGFVGWTELFDERGAMVAAERIDDTRSLCRGTTLRELYALDAGCEREPTEIICGRNP